MNNTTSGSKNKNMTEAPIILCLIFLLPIGVYLTLKHRLYWFKKIWFVILLAIYSLLWFGIFISVNSSPYDWSGEDKLVKDKYQSICEQHSNELASNTTEYEVCKRVGYPVHQIVTEVEVIPFTEDRVDDPSLAKGEEKVERDGVNGEKTIYYTVKFEKNTEVSRDKTADKITKEPVNKLVKVGTYVAPVAPAAPIPAPSQSQARQQAPSNSNNSPNSGVTDTVSGYCNDGTYVTGNPSARGRANACYGHKGWRDY